MIKAEECDKKAAQLDFEASILTLQKERMEKIVQLLQKLIENLQAGIIREALDALQKTAQALAKS